MSDLARGLRVLIVGAIGGSHIAGSLMRACSRLGLETEFRDMNDGWRLGTLPQKLFWHGFGKRPIRLRRFSRDIVTECKRFRPHVLIATGYVPITGEALIECRRMGTKCFNLSTDDPFNPTMRMNWFLRALPQYDTIFSPRRSNLDELRAHGCRDVRYLPFGYDSDLFFAPDAKHSEETSDLFFAGTAEQSRVEYVRAALHAGLSVRVYGDYWSRYSGMQRVSKGRADIPALREGLASCKVALCLVRHDNRDGHSMRTFEIPAVGACMVVEDTAEHREIFGDEGAHVVYFTNPAEMVTKTKELVRDSKTRWRLRDAAHALITNGHNTYADRLKTMLELVN